MSAFWYLDWLGILANRGHKGFCRQTLLGGNYGSVIASVNLTGQKFGVNYTNHAFLNSTRSYEFFQNLRRV